ncbi:hypothetical protein M758_UG171300, partial [Ceratodon purpureus]
VCQNCVSLGIFSCQYCVLLGSVNFEVLYKMHTLAQCEGSLLHKPHNVTEICVSAFSQRLRQRCTSALMLRNCHIVSHRYDSLVCSFIKPVSYMQCIVVRVTHNKFM